MYRQSKNLTFFGEEIPQNRNTLFAPGVLSAGFFFPLMGDSAVWGLVILLRQHTFCTTTSKYKNERNLDGQKRQDQRRRLNGGQFRLGPAL